MCVCVCVCVCVCGEREWGGLEGGQIQTTTTQVSYSKPSIKTESMGALAVYTSLNRLSLLSDCTGDDLLYTQVLAYFIRRW